MSKSDLRSEWDVLKGCEGGKMTVLESAARMYRPEARRDCSAGYIHGSGMRVSTA